MNEKLSTILSKLRQALSELYGDRLSKLILFGSQARGDAGPDSDIDILIVLKGPVQYGIEIERVGDITSAISLENDILISSVYMPEERFLTEESGLLKNIRREGLIL